MVRVPFLLVSGLIGLVGLGQLGACMVDNNEPAGLRAREHRGGPVVRFDLAERPFPDIPFPNDIATRVDPHSPTGRRLNLSELGAGPAEVKVRRYLNRLSGFGVYSPISLSFDAPLDVENLIARHQERVPNFEDDAVYIVNVDPKSKEYGKLELIDMGRGNFPVNLSRPDAYFVNDPRAQGTNLLFETVREQDTNGNGQLDWEEDLDDDGVLDVPNTRDPEGDPNAPGQLLNFYERETNGLILRPVNPLLPGTTYAVVLTRALTGEGGKSVESPFDYVNHASQTHALGPLREILPRALPRRFEAGLSEVAFAWSFTTQVPTEELQAVRAGLYGHGPLGWLGRDFPARMHYIHNVKADGAANPLTLDLAPISAFIIPVIAQEVGQEASGVLREAFKDIDYMVSGSFLSPFLLGDSDGLHEDFNVVLTEGANPQDDDESFDIDLTKGTARVRRGEVPFMCAVPKAQPGRPAPFPVIIYSHAIGSTRLEMLIFAGAMAKFGLATCTIDAVGHGLAIPPEYRPTVERVTRAQGIPNLGAVLEHHRARDIDNDGIVDPGADYFSADTLHSRDMMRQTTIDQMQLIRILRNFDGKQRWPVANDPADPFIAARPHLVAGWDQDGDGEPEIAGDFNADGIVDFGGEQTYVAWGTSLGGIQTALLAGVEPMVRAAASNAGGGGLGDIAGRTNIRNVRTGVVLRMMGPTLVGRPVVRQGGERTGETRLSWLIPSGISETLVDIGDVPGLVDGDTVVVRNLVREQNPLVPAHDAAVSAVVRGGAFRVGVGADALAGTARRAIKGMDTRAGTTRELMGCTTASSCAGQACPDNHYCSASGQCRSISWCVAEFDASQEGLPEELERRIEREPRRFGDGIVIDVYSAQGELKQTVDRFGFTAMFENIVYPKGSELAALAQGWGLKRQTPRFRKFLSIANTLLEPADPAVMATHYVRAPLTFAYEQARFSDSWTNFLTIGTLGDQTVPINAALSLARANGVLDSLAVDPRYGVSANQFLIDNFVYEGIHWLNRFPAYPNRIFDPDNLDQGRYRLPSEPDNADPKPVADKPLRATMFTTRGISALRLPYLRPEGEHTFNAPNPKLAFDIHTFSTNQVGWFLVTQGKSITDDLCLEDMFLKDCHFFERESFRRPKF